MSLSVARTAFGAERVCIRYIILVIVAALMPWLSPSGFCQSYPVPYTEFPFDVSRDNTRLDVRFRVKEDRVYDFNLKLLFDSEARRQQLFSLLGEPWRNPDGTFYRPGLTIPLHLTVSALGGDGVRTVVDRTVDTQGHAGMGADHYVRAIVDLRLPPGLYQLKANTTENIPSLSRTRSFLEIAYNPKVTPIR